MTVHSSAYLLLWSMMCSSSVLVMNKKTGTHRTAWHINLRANMLIERLHLNHLKFQWPADLEELCWRQEFSVYPYAQLYVLLRSAQLITVNKLYIPFQLVQLSMNPTLFLHSSHYKGNVKQAICQLKLSGEQVWGKLECKGATHSAFDIKVYCWRFKN